MLYAITFEINSIFSPGGSVKTTRAEIIGFAKSMAKLALDQLGDAVSFVEWFDLNGEETSPHKSLQSGDIDEIENIIGQISDTMQVHNLGYIGLWEYEDIFHLIEDQDVISWCSTSLKDRIATARKAYFGLVHELANEWVDA